MKIGIKVLGCPKNTADCEILAAILRKRGHEIVKSAEEADLVIIDTCTFIEDAKRESVDTILDFVYYKNSRGDLKLAVKGCMVQRYYRDLKKEIPEVDLWIGVVPPERVAEAIENFQDAVGTPEPVYLDSDHFSLDEKPYSYVKIADGCDRNCTFCTIPSFKGRYRSRPKEVILEEVRKLVEVGKKEIVLVSQDNTAYGTDIYGFQSLPQLLRELSKIPGDFWIRVMYLHPDYINDEMISTIAEGEKVIPYFEIPIQHASDRILKRMGRVRKRRELEKIFSKIRSYDDTTIRTTVMVGFPGESEEDFQQLLDFIELVHPDRMGVFSYSDEEGTVAHTFKDKVDPDVVEEREEVVLSLIPDLVSSSNERWLGRVVKAVVEEEEGIRVGRSWMDAPEIDGFIELRGEAKLGEFVKVEISRVYDYYMEGRIVG